MKLSFVAYGVAQPQGSARGFVPKGWTRAVITSDNPKNKGWRQVLAESASAALNTLEPSARRMAQGPVTVRALFYLPRPRTLPKRVLDHLKKPDLDKLLRSCVDALTGVCWLDDSQVVNVSAGKRYAPPGSPPFAWVYVEAPDGPDTSRRSTASSRPLQARSAAPASKPTGGKPAAPTAAAILETGHDALRTRNARKRKDLHAPF